MLARMADMLGSRSSSARVWRAEAEPRVGRCVLVSVMHAADPVGAAWTPLRSGRGLRLKAS